MIPAVVERCAGIDIGKQVLAVCIMTGPLDREPACEYREYGATVGELRRLADWLSEKQCTHIAAESTGSYWKSLHGILEERFAFILANPEQVKS